MTQRTSTRPTVGASAASDPIHGPVAGADWRHLCRMGGIAAFVQLALGLTTAVVGTIVGMEPTTATEYFTVLTQDRLVGLLRLDFPTMVLIALMPLPAFGIYAALRSSHSGYAALATALILIGTTLGLANHSAFSMVHLSDQYAAATVPVEGAETAPPPLGGVSPRFTEADAAISAEQLLAAGEAVIATDMWRSTGGFLAGLFMQGGFVFISVVMLSTSRFGKATAYSGILANGLDFVHVIVGLFLPAVGIWLLMVGGIFYLAWFPLLGRDLYWLGRPA